MLKNCIKRIKNLTIIKKVRFFMFDFRTDLASERRDIYKKANSIENEIDGIESEKEKIDSSKKAAKVKSCVY